MVANADHRCSEHRFALGALFGVPVAVSTGIGRQILPWSLWRSASLTMVSSTISPSGSRTHQRSSTPTLICPGAQPLRHKATPALCSSLSLIHATCIRSCRFHFALIDLCACFHSRVGACILVTTTALIICLTVGPIYCFGWSLPSSTHSCGLVLGRGWYGARPPRPPRPSALVMAALALGVLLPIYFSACGQLLFALSRGVWYHPAYAQSSTLVLVLLAHSSPLWH